MRQKNKDQCRERKNKWARVSASPWSGSLPWKFTKPSGWTFSFSFLVNPYDRFRVFAPQYKEIVSFCSFAPSKLQRKSRNLRNLTVQICLIFLEWEYFSQMNIWKIIYLNCRYEYMVDHRSYTQKLSSCEIKAWKRKCSVNISPFKPECFSGFNFASAQVVYNCDDQSCIFMEIVGDGCEGVLCLWYTVDNYACALQTK